MKYIKPMYTVKNVDVHELFAVGFRKYRDNSLVYRFPIYKYKNRPLVFCEFAIYDDDRNVLHINAFDLQGNSCNYNKEEYGRYDTTAEFNYNIWDEIKKMEKKGIILL